jgi:tripartite-type tricarboxylate transporter receptor subunit TctC
MAGLLIKDSGAKFKTVEAGSDADKLVTLQGGMIDAAFINASGAKQYADAGKVRILATVGGNPNRDPIVPDIPSFAELGYKNTVLGIDFIVLGPKGINAATVKKINTTLGAVVNKKEVIAQLTKANLPVGYRTLKESAVSLRKMDKKIGKVAKILGLGN